MMKPIIFNTNMVQAILSGRKTVTRRVVKPHPQFRDGETGTPVLMDDGSWEFQIDQYRNISDYTINPPYQTGDILYVRETWRVYEASSAGTCTIEYKAGGMVKFNRILALPTTKGEWKPSIHMPKEAARIFLSVTNVRVERLRDITPAQIDSEGCKEYAYNANTGELLPSGPSWFRVIWDSTIKPADLPLYGWDANPWVWVIEFERIPDQVVKLATP